MSTISSKSYRLLTKVQAARGTFPKKVLCSCSKFFSFSQRLPDEQMEQRTGKDEKPAEPRKSKTKMGLLQDIKACDPQLVDSQFSKLCSEFSLKLFSVLTGEPENYTCSPFSLLAALGLALSGARGSTANEILSALGLPAETDPQKNVHENFLKLMDCYVFMLNNSKEREKAIVNKLLKTKRVDAASSFDEILRKHYGSAV